MSSQKKELNPKQERFCEEYLIDLNATQAAIRAGYSAKTAQEQSSRLLSNVMVQRRIQELQDKRSNAVRIDAESILKELYDLAMVDITQAYDDAGWLKPLSEIPKEVRKAISALEVSELFDGQGEDKHIIGVNKKMKFYDKNKSLELLGKHLTLFTDKTEVTGPNNGPIQIDVADMSDEQIDARINELLSKKRLPEADG